jgi:hypothetical protein
MIAALAAAAVGCESKALRPFGGEGAGGWSSRPLARDAGAGDVAKPAGDAGPDPRLLDTTPAPLGVACSSATGCLSGFCVEGICCASACAGGCQTCAAPGAVGTCLARAAGAAPRLPADCPLESSASCGFDGTCDGAGACHFYLGNVCAPGVCANGVVTGASACDGQGICKPGVVTRSCAPYSCDPATNGCLSECQDDSQCSGGRHCQSGSCVGEAGVCTEDAECISGNCVDGVCCNTACQGPCVSCALPGKLGACSPVAAGMRDPRALCVDEGAPSCGHDGTCDGLGGCGLYAAGVSCAVGSSCSGTLWSGPGTCSGTGTCQRQTIPCLPFACDPQTNACHTTCTTADDCAAGNPCDSGSCGHNTMLDWLCSTDAECASGFCSQGVCCTARCDSPCSSCALPGTMGTCTPVPRSPDAGACAP